MVLWCAMLNKPGRNLSPLGTVAGAPAPHAEKYVLGHLLGRARVPEQAHGQRVDRPGVPVVEALQRFPRLLDDESHQLLIVALLEIHDAHRVSVGIRAPRDNVYTTAGLNIDSLTDSCRDRPRDLPKCGSRLYQTGFPILSPYNVGPREPVAGRLGGRAISTRTIETAVATAKTMNAVSYDPVLS